MKLGDGDREQLFERLSWMIGPTVGTPGSGSSGADLAPTAQQIAVNGEFKQQLGLISTEVKRLMDVDAPAFNVMLSQRGVTAVIHP